MSSPAMASFLSMLNTEADTEKVAAVAQKFMQDKLRENGFMRSILPPQKVTPQECHPHMENDSLYYIDWIAPNSQAVSLSFRGTPRPRYIRGSRYPISFHTISSERFQKSTQELQVYPYSITKVIEDNTVRDIQGIEDHRGLTHIEAACQATGQIVRGQQARDDADAFGTGTGFRGKLQRDDIIDLIQFGPASERMLTRVLISEKDWDDIMRWTIEQTGDSVQANIYSKGIKQTDILGMKFIRTIKKDILQPGNVYAFTDPEWLGKFLVLNPVQFYVDKEVNLVWWQSWQDIGIGIGGIHSSAKLELYNGTEAGDNGSDPLINEADVGSSVYNQVDDGVFMPFLSVR